MDTGYVWHQNKYDAVREQHDVTFGEVVDVFEDPEALKKPDLQGHRNRRMRIGRTREGRILRVIYNDVRDAPLVRIITAFEAEEKFRDEYLERRDQA